MSNQLKWILGALLISLGGLIGCAPDGGPGTTATTAASTGGSGGSPGTGGMTSTGGAAVAELAAVGVQHAQTAGSRRRAARRST
jgi:hypothetical protein